MINILIPVQSKDKDALIEHTLKNKYWALLKFDKGKVQEYHFYEKDWQEIDEFIDVVVVKSKDDYIWPFLEQSIPVLEAPFQKDIPEVMEAFIFKELYEVKL